MGSPSSARNIKFFDQELDTLTLVYYAHGAAVEGMPDWNGHNRRVVGDGESVIWVGAWIKGEVCECNFEQKIFLQSDMFKLCLKKKKHH